MGVDAQEAAPAGLTTAEADARRKAGEANTAVTGTSRSYATILRTNVFSFFNVVLFVIGIALLALGRYSDALISVGLGLINALISAVQEIRAKRKLDHLQLLDRVPVLVVRDGREVELAPEDVVRGDVLRIHAGAQIVVDGPLLDGQVEADESLLTGESDPVAKEPGDDLRSGTLCVVGRRSPARPRRRRGQLRRAPDRPGPPRHHRHDPAAAADRVRRPAGDRPGRADEWRHPGPGGAGGLHPAAGRADHRRAVRAGPVRTVLPHRGRLHGGRGDDRAPGRAGAAGERRRVGQQRRCRVHRQDRHPDHRHAHPRRGRAARRPRRRRGAGRARVAGPHRHGLEPDHARPGRGAAVRSRWGGTRRRPGTAGRPA